MASSIQGNEKTSDEDLMLKLVEKLTDMFNKKEINVIEAVGIYVIMGKLIEKGWILDAESLNKVVDELVNMARGKNTTLSSLGLTCLLNSIND